MSTPTASCSPDSDAAEPAAGPERPIVVRGPDELVASVPHLLGFVPDRSLVVVAMKGPRPRSRLGVVARFDLPPADRRRRRVRDASSAWVATVGDEAALTVLRDEPESVVALVYDEQEGGEHEAGGGLPWRRVVDRLDAALGVAGVPVLDQLLVSGDRFWSYRCQSSECCPAEGRVVLPEANAVTAEFVARGSSPLASRAALRDVVAASDSDRCEAAALAARRELTTIGRHWADDEHPGWRTWQRESATLLRDAAHRYVHAGAGLAAEEAGRLLAGLCDLTVRDVAVASLTGWGRQASDAEEQPLPGADTDGAVVSRMDALLAKLDDDDDTLARLPRSQRERVLERFWLELARSADGPLAVAPLTALGLHAWSQGNGALAGVVVERALALDPAYRLARLLEQALLIGMRPPGLMDADSARASRDTRLPDHEVDAAGEPGYRPR